VHEGSTAVPLRYAGTLGYGVERAELDRREKEVIDSLSSRVALGQRQGGGKVQPFLGVSENRLSRESAPTETPNEGFLMQIPNFILIETFRYDCWPVVKMSDGTYLKGPYAEIVGRWK
jgi:hypothetical protein